MTCQQNHGQSRALALQYACDLLSIHNTHLEIEISQQRKKLIYKNNLKHGTILRLSSLGQQNSKKWQLHNGSIAKREFHFGTKTPQKMSHLGVC